MGSLSADKAAVGSAVNDTTRQLGGTLGVAIVGSVFASVYSGRLGTDSARAARRRPLGDGKVDGRRRTAHWTTARGALTDVHDAVNRAFLDGLQVGSLVCAGIALGAAVIDAALMPARAPQYVGRHRRARRPAPAIVQPEPVSTPA